MRATLDVMGKKVEVEYEWLGVEGTSVVPHLRITPLSNLRDVLGEGTDEKVEALLEAIKDQIALPTLNRRADA